MQDSMKVKDLIRDLEEFDPELEVLFIDKDDEYCVREFDGFVKTTVWPDPYRHETWRSFGRIGDPEAKTVLTNA